MLPEDPIPSAVLWAREHGGTLLLAAPIAAGLLILDLWVRRLWSARRRKPSPMSKAEFRRFTRNVRRRNAPFDAALAKRPLPPLQSVANAFQAHRSLLQIHTNQKPAKSWQHGVSSRVRADAAFELAIRGQYQKALRQLEDLVAWLKRNPDASDGRVTADGFYRIAAPVTPAKIYAGAGAIGYLIDDASAARYYALSHAEDGTDAQVALMLAVLLLRLGPRDEAKQVIARLVALYRAAHDRAAEAYDKDRGRGPLEVLSGAERDLKDVERLLAEAIVGAQTEPA